jgi:hypothetical protein
MRILALCVAGALMAGTAVAQQQPSRPPAKTMSGSLGLYVFPTQNQNAQTQQADETACYAWSKENTGFDPLAAASAGSQASAQQPPKGAGAKGAARGAAAGAAIGAINGDAGQGAATGAAGGAIRGRLAAKRAERQAEKAQEQAQQAQARGMDGFRRAFGACMEAKGYTVK